MKNSDKQFSKVGAYLKNDLKETAGHIKEGTLGKNIGSAANAVGKVVASPITIPGKVITGAANAVGKTMIRTPARVIGHTIGDTAGGFIHNIKKGYRNALKKDLDNSDDIEWDFSAYAKSKQFDSTEDKLENLERRKKNLEENGGDDATIAKVTAKIKKIETKENSPIISGADDEATKEEFGVKDYIKDAVGNATINIMKKKAKNAGKDFIYAAKTLPTMRGLQGVMQGISASMKAKEAKEQAESGDMEGAFKSAQEAIGSGAQAYNIFRRPKRTFWEKVTGRNRWKRFSGISDQLADSIKEKAAIGMRKKLNKLKDEDMKKIVKQFSDFCGRNNIEFNDENLAMFSDMKFCFHKFCEATGTPFTSSNFDAFCDCGVCPVCQEEKAIDKNEEVAPPSSTEDDDDLNEKFFAETGETELPSDSQGVLPEDKAKAKEQNEVKVEDGSEEVTDHDVLKAFSEFCEMTGTENTAENFVSFSEAFDENELPPETPEKPETSKEDDKAAKEDEKSTVEDGESEVKDHEALKQEFAEFCEKTGIENNEENFKLFSEDESDLPKSDQGISPEDKKAAEEDNKAEVEDGLPEVTDHEDLKAFSEFCDATGIEYSKENFKAFSAKRS